MTNYTVEQHEQAAVVAAWVANITNLNCVLCAEEVLTKCTPEQLEKYYIEIYKGSRRQFFGLNVQPLVKKLCGGVAWYHCTESMQEFITIFSDVCAGTIDITGVKNSEIDGLIELYINKKMMERG